MDQEKLRPVGEPPAALKEKMAAAFGSVDGCKKELASMAVSQFGSGWDWNGGPVIAQPKEELYDESNGWMDGWANDDLGSSRRTGGCRRRD